MPPIIGEATAQVPAGVLGTATPQTIPDPDGGNRPVNVTGAVGLTASSPDEIDEWIDVRRDFGPLGNVAVLGVALGRTASGDLSQSPWGFLAGNDPIFNASTGVYGESQNQGVVGISKGPAANGVLGAASQAGSNFDPARGGNGVFGTGYIGLRGETQTGVAVLGRVFGPGIAGRFEGNLEVTGRIRGPEGDVEKRVDQLEQQMRDLLNRPPADGGRTNFGQSIPATVTRPHLIVTETTPGSFSAKGSDFDPQLDHIHIIPRHGFTSETDVFATGSGDQRQALFSINKGDAVTVVGTDKRSDFNDVTGLLWSHSVDVSFA
jgi:hypothetical protein